MRHKQVILMFYLCTLMCVPSIQIGLFYYTNLSLSNTAEAVPSEYKINTKVQYFSLLLVLQLTNILDRSLLKAKVSINWAKIMLERRR